MTTTQQILDYVKNHPSGKVKLAVADIDGILRGKYVSAEKFASLAEGRLGFCDVTFGWDANDAAYDNVKYTGWHTGYPDAQVKIDLSTFRKIPWENDVPFFLGDFIDDQEKPNHVCPRQLLKKIISSTKDQGFSPLFAQEFEWFNFAESPESLTEKGFVNLKPLSPGMFGYSVLRSSLKNEFMTDLFDLLSKFDIPIEGLHTETGPGVYEAAIKYAPALQSADQALLFKTSVKEIAYKHGVIATFMAKISEQLPGCSGHVHQSLWDADLQKNLFYDEADEHKMSSIMKSYIAGQLFCLPHILPLIAPTINSYKRLVEGAWAPTTVTWGIDNRTTALRALPGSKKASRLETRIVGSDTNPYLAMSACLAAGLYGIQHHLKLEQAATKGNGYTDLSNGVLSRNLSEATQRMKNSELANTLLGAEFVAHFAATREWECKQYAKAVTDWELKRYLEII
ncbi:glutamine synthetase family protein [Pedobacter rhizosphaerae]|uniref:Glutamine synthetase n=1 Tax=Pedobacter rhizosphaerae TaxID=390241 RepID=A0A1H9VNM1_9SPHI|nr:glutamine synthetase family protein [Pedobacter rhizosphaerae]SES22937.1 glutamine synthetase [Pedobacter rhizosphaerae]